MTTETIFFKPPEVSNSHYVYFKADTGEIVTVSNTTLDKEGLSCIAVSFEQVEDLLSGKEPFNSRRIEFDTKTKSYALKEFFEENLYDVNELIYKVVYNKDAEIQVIQDLKNTCWKFLISPELRAKILEDKVSLKIGLSFSVTEKENPNILYRTLQFPFNDLIKNGYLIKDFKEDYEFDGTPVSIYTIKRFESYSYEVINE